MLQHVARQVKLYAQLDILRLRVNKTEMILCIQRFEGNLECTVSLDSQADERINDKRRAELGNWKGSEQLSLDLYARRELRKNFQRNRELTSFRHGYVTVIKIDLRESSSWREAPSDCLRGNEILKKNPIS